MTPAKSVRISRPSNVPLVADSGPLLALARADALHLPLRLYRRVLVPRPVLSEVVAKPAAADALAVAHAIERRWLTVHAKPLQPLKPSDPALGEGEAAALALASSIGAVVLIDELRGRAVAAALGIRYTGSLAILLAAKQRGLVKAVAPLLRRMQDSGYHLSRQLVAQVLAIAGER